MRISIEYILKNYVVSMKDLSIRLSWNKLSYFTKVVNTRAKKSIGIVMKDPMWY
jgi:hypothetical protein